MPVEVVEARIKEMPSKEVVAPIYPPKLRAVCAVPFQPLEIQLKFVCVALTGLVISNVACE